MVLFLLFLYSVNLAEQEKASIVDVDGSYTHKKYLSLTDAGLQVLLPQPPCPPLAGWQSVKETTHQSVATSIPQVTSGMF